MAGNESEKRLSLWSPAMFGDFRKEMDTMLEKFFGVTGSTAARTGMPSLGMEGAIHPAIDISENGDTIVLTAELPGMTEEQVDLSVSNGILTLKGEKQVDHESDREDIHLVERSYGSFMRSFPLPDRVKADAIEAKFDRGVLVVKMPKKPGSGTQKRKIPVGK